jgi:hypothetical protein
VPEKLFPVVDLQRVKFDALAESEGVKTRANAGFAGCCDPVPQQSPEFHALHAVPKDP